MIKKITYFLIFISLFNSCRKYDFDTSTIENKEWFLVAGKVYLENLTTGELTYYEHFDDSQSSSNLDVFGGSNIDFDKIHKYKTKWYFSDGLFTLNDSTTCQYTTQGSGVKKQYNIIGILPYGSSRNLGILYFDDNRMDVVVYEANESHLGDNYHYYTVLTFVTNNSSCNLCNYSNTTGYEYGGTITITTNINGYEQLSGTSWLITRYDIGMTPYYPNDTINFINSVSYNINGSNEKTYSLSNNVGNNLYNLTLYECVTLGGNYSGQVSLSFIDFGELNNLTMNGIFGTSGSINLWMTRLY